MTGVPSRLVLQTGRLDDERPAITADHELWPRAYELFRLQDHIDGARQAAELDRLLHDVCAAWPAGDTAGADGVEALAVAVALAAPFATQERILRALEPAGAKPAAVARFADVAIVAHPPVRPRRRLPRVYDPDVEQRSPIDAVLDGPRSPAVGRYLELVKEHDLNLADAIVLGAEVEMIDELERLGAAARDSGRSGLAAMFENDRRRWSRRADTARARQRLEGLHYGWRGDNYPPACLEAARSEVPHKVDALLHAPPAPAG